ncbi:MAG: hypothetical protein Tp136DCM211861_44 [Prokaryotic dsDNA virus sp.]|jgi:hypothetical protein|nr:MAG: hypothetical protein Tp136DCM211861_44 [Prokaryotic dsDNA virus sp.]|tara:strand:- start:17815 stop:19575 length:1761 start_codon:yes stop_codon:yes gene_type:complete
MVDIYYQEQQDDPNLRNQYHDFAKAGTLDVLGATLEETLYYNPLNALDRLAEQKLGFGREGRTISQDEWRRSDFYRPGIEVGDEGITTGLATLLADRYDERADFQSTLSRSKGGIGLGAAQFGVAIAGSFADPLNIASVFIPSVGAARFASLSARYGAGRSKIATGVIDGAIGAAVIEPVVIGAAVAEQDRDYNLMDSFLNVAVGAGLGGSINALTGGISSFGRYTRQRRLARLKAVEADQAQRISIKQVMNDEEVNLSPIEESVQSRTEAADAAISEKKIVYQTDGTPVEVEVLDVDDNGDITVRTADGQEKTIDASDLRSKSPFDEDYKYVDASSGREEFEISTLEDAALDSILESTERLIADIEAGDADTARLGSLEAHQSNLTALKIEKRRRAGETVEKPAEPDISGADASEIAALRKEAANIQKKVLERAEKEGLAKPRVKAAEATRLGEITARINELESATQEAGDMVDVQDGRVTTQQAQNEADAATMQGDGLGRLGEHREAVQEIKQETTELDEPDPAEIEAENEILMEDLASDDVQAILPADIKRSLAEVDELQTKADGYEEVSRAGANCLIGDPGR